MNYRLIFIFLLVTLAATSCFDPPEIPIEPKISLKSFTFKSIPGNQFQDSLIVELNFEDGDGDLGLSVADTLEPFNEKYFFRLDNGQFLKFGDSDTLPPYSCRDYELITLAGDNIDTFYVRRNDYHYNFHLDFYRKVDGQFELVDFYLLQNCSPGFKGRFFRLNTTDKERPLEGVLRYGAPSGFRVFFRNDTLKFRVFIYDRNEPGGYPNREKKPHKSNVVESREFTLSEFLGPI